jgi:Na+/citrate or Na+/malate symporter
MMILAFWRHRNMLTTGSNWTENRMKMEMDLRDREYKLHLLRLMIAAILIGTVLAVQTYLVVKNPHNLYWCSGIVVGMCVEVLLAMKWVFPVPNNATTMKEQLLLDTRDEV